MKKDEKQKLIEAAKTIKDYCDKQNKNCKDCIFYEHGRVHAALCALTNWPNFWLDDIKTESNSLEKVVVGAKTPLKKLR